MTNRDLTSINVIIDESGSMGFLREDTIGGINTFIEEQKKLSGKATLTLTKFATEVKVLYENLALEDVKLLTDDDYKPSGGTALYDAVGTTMAVVGKRLDALSDEERPGKVIFLIVTDGGENMSREFTQEGVKAAVEHQREKYSWEFVFLGANIDAATVGSSIGVATRNSVQYTASPAGSAQLYSSVSAGMSSYRGGDVQTKDFLETTDIQVGVTTLQGITPSVIAINIDPKKAQSGETSSLIKK